MIYYRPTDGNVHNAPIRWKPRTAFLMLQLGGTIPAEVADARKTIDNLFGAAGSKTVDANTATTGKDFLLKIWQLAVACPVGIAVVHEGISDRTLANIHYELGGMHAYGRETLIVRLGQAPLPSDLVRTEYIRGGTQLETGLKKFLASIEEQAGYYITLADQLENDPLLAIDYLRRAYLLTGDKNLKARAEDVFDSAQLSGRAKGSVERMMVKF